MSDSSGESENSNDSDSDDFARKDFLKLSEKFPPGTKSPSYKFLHIDSFPSYSNFSHVGKEFPLNYLRYIFLSLGNRQLIYSVQYSYRCPTKYAVCSKTPGLREILASSFKNYYNTFVVDEK
ncbi:hypothetical protein RIR_jg29832.t1 [Rhizophagus irregularis DAOM 181602=DAOM 197198]|uniref:Uncharacterized protein n=1 Tax=Rhizophagus irregularis (strain DAOM 181602 / DAOM 197198 / MUCL 43194) TaxID=747089 RepID=U9U2U2_RHIID|nr:hypothetical protein RIR_jg29832.t1 [Rhizophagus irregularis DAOM 181602=DAOM 197198]